ncbi:MAG: nucleotide-binding protein, partial [Beggiatoa sp. IS2]
MNQLRIVLDTNVLLVSLSSKSQYHWLFQKLLNEQFKLYITTEILMEYEEIIALKYHPEVAKNVLRTLL